MNVIETIIAVILLLLIVLTAINEPKLSFEYWKQNVKTAFSIVRFFRKGTAKIKPVVKDELNNLTGVK